MTPVKQQRRYASGKSGKIRSKGGRNEASPVSSRLRESNADLLIFVGVVPMQMIAPCVKRAFLDSGLPSEYMTQVELLGNVIASAGFGLVLVRSNRKIVCANEAAEKLMRASSGLRCEHGCICAPNFKTAWKLQSLISAASRPMDEAVPGGSIILRNQDGLASLVVHVVPFSPPSTVLMPENERPVAGVLIVDCQRDTTN